VVVLTKEGRFVLRARGSRIRCFSIDFRDSARSTTELSSAVERLMAEQYGLDISYLGLIGYSSGDGRRLLAAGVLETISSSLVDDPTLKFLSLAQTASLRSDVDHSEYCATVWRWWEATRVTRDLNARIRRAISTSLSYLDTHMSVENGRSGWNLYQDGTSIGTLSTAEALLAHVHADVRGEFVERPAETLEALQNPDGGWQVRRSLVGARSEVSVTESTCACLWALREVGRSISSSSVQRAVAWLETCQRPDGGWPSAAGGNSLVFPTTAALRVIAGAGSTDVVAKGVAWLRGAQRPDGGWGAVGQHATEGVSEPAYTGYALITLIKCGVQPTDPAIEAGCNYLIQTFDPDREEPWRSTSFMTVVDPENAARLDFRHFGTPWALAALVAAGHGLDDFAVLSGVDRLLGLQQENGTWRCSVSTPESPPVWATHDALYALRSVLMASSNGLAVLALSPYHAQERDVAQVSVARALAHRERSQQPMSRRGRLTSVWLSILTVGVLMLTFSYLGVFREWEAGSDLSRAGAALASIVVTAIGAAAPLIAIEEYKIRRGRTGRSDPDTAA
jgi:hypothetical protein